MLVLIGILFMLTDIANSWGWAVLAIAIVNWISYWCGHHVALRPCAQPVTESRNPYLYRVVSEQAQLAGLPRPKVYEVRSPLPNAHTIGRSPRHTIVGVSSALQSMLGHRELEAVIAHEMAHVRNRDGLTMTVATTIVGVILSVSMLAGLHGWIGGVVLLPFPMSWLREFRADATAAYACGGSVALANALRRLPRSGFLSFLFEFDTHPPTRLRVWRLEKLAKRRA